MREMKLVDKFQMHLRPSGRGRARRNEKNDGGCPGIRPGDRGKDGGAGPPIPCIRHLSDERQNSPVPLGGFAPVKNANVELSG
jgi:hypothetical protein